MWERNEKIEEKENKKENLLKKYKKDRKNELMDVLRKEGNWPNEEIIITKVCQGGGVWKHWRY